MIRSRRSGSAVALVAILVLAPILVSGAPVPTTSDFASHSAETASQSNDSAPTSIDSCTRITRSGHYVLSDDIETRQRACLRIEANDVTFDGAGHVVDGQVFRDGTAGIAVTGRNVTVRNVTATNWTFGIEYENASAGTVANVTTWRTADGVSVLRSPETRLRRVTATNGFTGIAMTESNGSRISDSNVRDTSSSGVFVSDSENVSLANVSVVRSKIGVALAGVRNGSMTDVVVRSTEDGILLIDSHDNTIRNATLTNPDGSAVVTRSNANANDNPIVGSRGNWTTRDASRTHAKNGRERGA